MLPHDQKLNWDELIMPENEEIRAGRVDFFARHALTVTDTKYKKVKLNEVD